MKYKIIFFLDLGFIPNISHYVYANIPKSVEKKFKAEVLLVPSILDEEPLPTWDSGLGLTDSNAMPKIWAWNL